MSNNWLSVTRPRLEGGLARSKRPRNDVAQGDPLNIFVSYSRADLDAADSLVAALEAEGFTVVIDRRDLPYGEKWQQVLYEYIRDCDTVIFLVSQHAIRSQWVQWELQQVTELNKRLVPLMIESCPTESLPPAIASVELLPKQGVFTLEADKTALVDALNTDRTWVMEATKLHSRARDWIRADRNVPLLLRGTALEAAERWRAAKPNLETIPGNVLDFLLSSRQNAIRRQRNWIIGSVSAAIVGFALAAAAYLQSVEAARQKQEAETQRIEAEHQSNVAVAQSAAVTSLSSDNDPARGLLLVVEALRRSRGAPTVTTIAAHRNALFRFGATPLLEAGRRGLSVSEVSLDYNQYKGSREDGPESIDLSGDGRWVFATSRIKGTLELWLMDLDAEDPASTFSVVDTGSVDLSAGGSVLSSIQPEISRNGRFVAVGDHCYERRLDNTYQPLVLPGIATEDLDRACMVSYDEKYVAQGNHLWRIGDAGPERSPVLMPKTGPDDVVFFAGDPIRVVAITREEEDRIKVRSWAPWPIRDQRQESYKSLEALTIAYPQLLQGSAKPVLRESAVVSPDGRWEVDLDVKTLDVEVPSRAILRHYDTSGARIERGITRGDPSGSRSNEPRANRLATSLRNAAFSRNSRWLATIGDSLQIWDLAKSDPLESPVFELAEPGTHVAVESSGRWVATFGTRLLVWDLSLDVPAAFPIETKSNLESLQVRPIAENDDDDLWLRFSANGAWLVVQSTGVNEEFMEFWDLRLDDGKRDGALAQRNLSQKEWDSFFPNTQFNRTFVDQPLDPEPLRAADSLARSGRVEEAVEAYRRVANVEPGIGLNPEKRAGRLAAAYYWSKGEETAADGQFEAGLKLLQRAKELNPQLPWDPALRAGQIWAAQWSKIMSELRGPEIPWVFGDWLKVDVNGLLAKLRAITVRYPRFRFGEGDHRNAPSVRLYQFGLRNLTERTTKTAKMGEFQAALRLRDILVRDRWPEAPTAEQLRALSLDYLKADLASSLVTGQLVAFIKLERVAAIDPALANRMRPALDLMESFAQLESVRDDAARADAAAREFRTVMSRIDASARRDAYEVVGAEPLNRICWEATNRYGLGAVVLPLCEDAVQLASDRQRPSYRDSRGAAYAVVGRLDDAIADFQAYVSSPSAENVARRRQWIEALTACKSDPANCNNPFADAAFHR